MTITRGLLTIVLCAVGFAGGGGVLGFLLGVLAPGYYRGVFASGREPWFDPVEVGLGLGISQGATCGVFVGAIVVLAVAWLRSRRSTLDLRLDSGQGWKLARPLEGRSDDQGIIPHRPAAPASTGHTGPHSG